MWEGRGKICTCNTLLPKVSQNERVKYVCDYGYEWYVFFMRGMFFYAWYVFDGTCLGKNLRGICLVVDIIA